jgi:hypothetical protein
MSSSKLSNDEHMILSFLYDQSIKEGLKCIDVLNKDLMKLVNKCETTVQKCLKKLESLNLIKRHFIDNWTVVFHGSRVVQVLCLKGNERLATYEEQIEPFLKAMREYLKEKASLPSK